MGKKRSKDIVQRAREKIKEILAVHKIEPLEKEIEQKMTKIIEEGQKT